jgi:hypothetical protein
MADPIPDPPGKLIPLTQIPDLPELPLRRGGAKLNVATLYRWAIKGSAGVILPTVRVGATLCTTREEFFQWLADVAAARRNQSNVRDEAAPGPFSQQRQKEIAAAQAKLAAVGV